MSIDGRTIRDGVVAGLLAGFVLAVLFYFYDLGQGTPLRTPAFLWGAIVTRSAVPEPSAGIVIGFTMIHFTVWAALGVGTAALTKWIGLSRNLFVGIFYGLFTCSFLFYLGLIRAPVEMVLQAPGWPAVFFGNALAGIVMFTHLHWVSGEPGVVGVMNFLKTHRVVRVGVVAGLLGAVVMAAWFFVIDTALREPLYTPAALATVFFRGGAGPGAVEIDLAGVAGYSLVHFGFFILFGILCSAAADKVERMPALGWAALLLFVVFEVFFVAMVAVLGRWILAEIAWWSVLIGNVLAAVVISGYLWRQYPGFKTSLVSEKAWAD